MKKLVAAFFAIAGFILLLAGVGLITLTQTFLLYAGVFLLLFALVLFFFK